MRVAIECIGGPMDGSAFEIENRYDAESVLYVRHNGSEHIASHENGPPYGPGPLLGVYRFHQRFMYDCWMWEPSS